MTLETRLAFFVACWVISLSPGAGAIASMSCGLRYGFWRGYWNAIGLQLALVLQIAVVAAGVGAVLATSELAFGLIKWFGVCYLLWLARKQWQAQPEALDDSAAPRPIGRPLSSVLRGFGQCQQPQGDRLHSCGAAAVPRSAAAAAAAVQRDGRDHGGGRSGGHGRLHRACRQVLRLLRTPRQQRTVNRSFATMFAGAAACWRPFGARGMSEAVPMRVWIDADACPRAARIR